jgi:hypothetical protein
VEKQSEAVLRGGINSKKTFKVEFVNMILLCEVQTIKQNRLNPEKPTRL